MNSNENGCPNLPSTHTTRSTHLGWLVSLPWGSKAPLCSAAVFTGPQSRARIPVSEPSPVLPPPPFRIPPPPVSHSSTMTPPSTPLQHLFSRTSTLVRSPQQVYERKFQDQVSLPTSHLWFFKRVLPGCFPALCSYCILFALRSATSAVCLSLEQLPRISWVTFTVSLSEPCVGFLTQFCFPKYLCAKCM